MTFESRFVRIVCIGDRSWLNIHLSLYKIVLRIDVLQIPCTINYLLITNKLPQLQGTTEILANICISDGKVISRIGTKIRSITFTSHARHDPAMETLNCFPAISMNLVSLDIVVNCSTWMCQFWMLTDPANGTTIEFCIVDNVTVSTLPMAPIGTAF